MAVEMPARREQKVPTLHRHRVAVDDGPHPLAFHHEAERVLGVPMLRRGLAGGQVLNRRPQSRGGVGKPAEPGVGQRDRPALAAPVDRDQLSGLLGEVEDRAPPPDMRPRAGRRLPGHQLCGLGPQRGQLFLAERLVQIVALRDPFAVRWARRPWGAAPRPGVRQRGCGGTNVTRQRCTPELGTNLRPPALRDLALEPAPLRSYDAPPAIACQRYTENNSVDLGDPGKKFLRSPASYG